MPELFRGDSTELVGCHNAESELRLPDAKPMDVRLCDEAEEEILNDEASDALEPSDPPPGWSGSLNQYLQGVKVLFNQNQQRCGDVVD